ncbi:serine-rich adhesin for platelets-like [Argopecten irradians]|uniref:serine-rich adhesin for platelets-like n=1 Tax=Argopecten irradians TaxID=31199 RepID=UPI00371B0902
MSKERKNGNSDNVAEAGIKHILRSGIKITEIEKTFSAKKTQSQGRNEAHGSKKEITNAKVSEQTSKSSLKKRNKLSFSDKNFCAMTCSGNVSQIHVNGTPNRKHSALRHSPRLKMTQSSDSSCKKSNNPVTDSDTKCTSSNLNGSTSIETQSETCSNGISSSDGRDTPEISSRNLRRLSSSPESCSNSARRLRSPCKSNTAKSNRRNSFPQTPLRTSPRRKSPVKYCYGNSRSPKRKNKMKNSRRASASPDKRATRSNTTNSVLNENVPKGSISFVKSLPASVKPETKSNMKTVFRSTAVSLKTELKYSPKTYKYKNIEFEKTGSSKSPKKVGNSATERELKKITDYWSPKQSGTNTARILRNGRSLDASISPKIKYSSIKLEPKDELENDGRPVDAGNSYPVNFQRAICSSVRREINFGQIVSTAKRKHENTTEDEDEDDDSHVILRRKKLRSEVKNDELWEGLQIQRFKRLTPKKEKNETHTLPNAAAPEDIHCDNRDTNGCDTDSAESSGNKMDFSTVIVKKERFDDGYEEGCYNPGTSQTKNNVQEVKPVLETDSYAINQYYNLKIESEDVSVFRDASKMEERPSNTELNIRQSETKDFENDILYGPDNADFHFQPDESPEQHKASVCDDQLDLECDTSVSQTMDTERDLEDTFLYYDMPSPSELERSQPILEFHEYNSQDESNKTTQEIVKTMKLDNQSPYCESQAIEPENEASHDGSVDAVVVQSVTVHGEKADSYQIVNTAEGCGSSAELQPLISVSIVDDGHTDDSISDPLSTLTATNEDYGDESNDIDISSNNKPDIFYTQPVSEEQSNTSEKVETEEYSKTVEPKHESSQAVLDEESNFQSNTQEEKQEEISEITDADQNNEQKIRILDDFDEFKSNPSAAITTITPIKPRQITEGTTPKRSVRLQERRESTPSRWEEEYVFTPLRRIEENKKLVREHRNNRGDTEELSNMGRTDSITEQNRDDPNWSQSDDYISASKNLDDTCLISTSKMQKSDIEIACQPTGICERLTDKDKAKITPISSEDNPPLKIRVKKSADGTTRIVASPASKSAVLNVLTPCDKKQKKKVVPMRSLLKPNLVPRKCHSPPSISKRKKSQPLEEPSMESGTKCSDPKNKKKKEGRQSCDEKTRRHQSHTTIKGEKTLSERYGKRKIDDSEELMKNVLVGKHASILWLSENRRHFLLKHAESSPSEIDAMLCDAWKNLGEKEKLKYYQRANGAMRDENKHSTIKSRLHPTAEKQRSLLEEDEKMSKKMRRFLSLSPMEQHEELRRWLRFFVYEVSPAEYSKLMADFKGTMKELRENKQMKLKVSDLEMQALYRKILFQKILDLQDKIVDIYHQKRERQDEIVKEGFEIITKRLIVGDDVAFSTTVHSNDLQQVLLDLKLLENERKVAVSGTPLKSKSYENVLEQLQECEQLVGVGTPLCSSGKPSPESELPEADSRFANELLSTIRHQQLPQFEVFSLERDLGTDRGGCLPNEEEEEITTEEIFEKLSQFFNQEALLNHDMNFWAPGLTPGRCVSGTSSVLTDTLLADQFKMLARNPTVFGSGVKMLIDPNQLESFMQERNVYGFRSTPGMVHYPSTLLRYAPSSGDKNQNGYTKRRAPASKYDKYRTHSLSGHSPVTVHYANRSRYPISHPVSRMHHISQIPRQPPQQPTWRPPSVSPLVTQRPRISTKEHESRYTSIIHRRIQNVEGGTVVQYTASSLGRRQPS